MSCNLTDAEWKLMHRLWEQSPQTITQLTAALSAETGWEKHTVITMLIRLEAKGAVRHEAGGRAKPVLSRRRAERRRPAPRPRAFSVRSTAAAWD